MLARITSIGKNKNSKTASPTPAPTPSSGVAAQPSTNDTNTGPIVSPTVAISSVATPPSYHTMTPTPYYATPDMSQHGYQQPIYAPSYTSPAPPGGVAPTSTPLPVPPSSTNATNGNGDGKEGVPIKEGKLEAMIFAAMATATKKIKARGLVVAVKVMGKVLGLTLHMSVTVERMAGEEVACDDSAIGNAEERSFFKRKLEKAVDKMLTSSEKLARRMRMRGLRGSVGGSLEITIWSIGIAIEIDISLEALELGGTLPYDTQPIDYYTGLPPVPVTAPTAMMYPPVGHGAYMMHPHQQ